MIILPDGITVKRHDRRTQSRAWHRVSASAAQGMILDAGPKQPAQRRAARQGTIVATSNFVG
jgi:hypothetical protein